MQPSHEGIKLYKRPVIVQFLVMKKHLLLALAILFYTSFSMAASIGVTPGYINYGEVEKGETIEIEFYVTTSDIDQEFQITPEYQKSLRYALGENAVIDMREVSEQNIDSWINLDEETFTIDPNTSETYQLPDGTSVRANGVMSFEVKVPPNAEPGYKIGTIQLNPNIPGDQSGAGARLIAQTTPGFAFRVPGSVNRQIELTDTRAVRVGENQVQVIERIRNTGTVTTTMIQGQADITNSDGQKVGSLTLDAATLRPGESAEIDQLWTTNNLEGGQYNMEGTGDYRTGEMYVSGSFTVTDSIQERQSIDEPSASSTEEGGEAPITLIAILTVLLATLLYLIDVSVFWIMMLAGGLAITLFILLGPASNLLVVIPLISIGIMFYI